MDNSLLRFLNDFNKAKDLGNSLMANEIYDNQIQLDPNEDYGVITNVPTGIAFNGNFKAYIVDCANNILDTITNNIYIEEFNHNETGLRQMKIEIVALKLEHYDDLVYMRIDHDIVGGDSFWSNPFILSEYRLNETTRFDFKNYENLDGTCYEEAEFYQSIRLRCFRDKNSIESSSQAYTTLDGLKYSSRVIKSKNQHYIFDMLNDFTYERLQYILGHDVIYVDGKRATNKQTVDNDDRFSSETNVSLNKFKVPVDDSDLYTFAYQIFQPLIVLSKTPDGSLSLNTYNSLTSISTQYKISFNKAITSLASNISGQLFKNNILFATFNNTKFSFSGMDVLIDVSSNPVTADDTYYMVIPNGKINSGSETFVGFIAEEWKFELRAGDYKAVDYNNPDYNT